MIRVERREFSGLKIYDSLLCKFFLWSQFPGFCHQTAPETRQNKVSIVEAFGGELRFDTPETGSGCRFDKTFASLLDGALENVERFASYIRPFTEWIIKVLTIGMLKFRVDN